MRWTFCTAIFLWQPAVSESCRKTSPAFVSWQTGTYLSPPWAMSSIRGRDFCYLYLAQSCLPSPASCSARGSEITRDVTRLDKQFKRCAGVKTKKRYYNKGTFMTSGLRWVKKIREVDVNRKAQTKDVAKFLKQVLSPRPTVLPINKIFESRERTGPVKRCVAG